MHIKAAQIIHNVPPKVFIDHDISHIINWETLGYMYKRRLATEVCKIKLGLNDRLPFINFTESKRKGILLSIK